MTNTQMTEFMYELFKEQSADWKLTLQISFYCYNSHAGNSATKNIYPIITRQNGELTMSGTLSGSTDVVREESGDITVSRAHITSVSIYTFEWL